MYLFSEESNNGEIILFQDKIYDDVYYKMGARAVSLKIIVKWRHFVITCGDKAGSHKNSSGHLE